MYKTVTAVIPAYNEEAQIASVVLEVSRYVAEVIVVNDGSSDRTAEIATQSGAKVISLPENQGYIAALKSGFRKATKDVVVTLDADGEFQANFIPTLVKPILCGEADMVQGCRDAVPRPSERLLTWLANFKHEVGDSGTGMRAIKTDLARSLEIDAACICGILSLEVIKRGGIILDVPIKLKHVDKPRKIAWFHIRQFFCLLPWLLKDI